MFLKHYMVAIPLTSKSEREIKVELGTLRCSSSLPFLIYCVLNKERKSYTGICTTVYACTCISTRQQTVTNTSLKENVYLIEKLCPFLRCLDLWLIIKCSFPTQMQD